MLLYLSPAYYQRQSSLPVTVHSTDICGTDYTYRQIIYDSRRRSTERTGTHAELDTVGRLMFHNNTKLQRINNLQSERKVYMRLKLRCQNV